MDARFLDAAADRERAQSLPAMAAVARKPLRPFLENVADPVQRLHVVLERRPAEQAHLRHVGRAHSRLAPLALNRFDHRGLFTEDGSAGPASRLDVRDGIRRIGVERSALALEDRPPAAVLVARVDINSLAGPRPRRDQRAFEKTARMTFELVTVLELPGLAFVDVDREQARRR